MILGQVFNGRLLHRNYCLRAHTRTHALVDGDTTTINQEYLRCVLVILAKGSIQGPIYGNKEEGHTKKEIKIVLNQSLQPFLSLLAHKIKL